MSIETSEQRDARLYHQIRAAIAAATTAADSLGKSHAATMVRVRLEEAQGWALSLPERRSHSSGSGETPES